MQARVGLAIISALLVAACGRVPPQEAVNSIPIHDIVQRVKCELADSLEDKLRRDDFAWMTQWTVAVDLTLEVNQQGGVTPNGGYIQPLKNVLYPRTGPSSFSSNGTTSTSAIARKFVFGASANVAGQAVRTELLSFSLALEELRVWRAELRRKMEKGIPTEDARGCDLPEGFDLDGTLRLKEWLDTALAVVTSHDLEQGFHPRPGTGGASVSKAKPPPGKEDKFTEQKVESCKPEEREAARRYAERAESYRHRLAAAREKANDAEKQAADVERQARQSTVLTPHFRDRAIENATKVESLVKLAQEAADEAGKAIDFAKEAADRKDCDANDAKINEVAAHKDLTIAESRAEQAAQLAEVAKKYLKPDPPIDSISQQVQFVVTTSASIAPSWLLVHWQGPSTTGNLASLQGIRTHTLNVTLGKPSGDTPTRALTIINSENVVNAIRSLGGGP
jgi:hypothetical protein